jgi:hypothetical protein
VSGGHGSHGRTESLWKPFTNGYRREVQPRFQTASVVAVTETAPRTQAVMATARAVAINSRRGSRLPLIGKSMFPYHGGLLKRTGAHLRRAAYYDLAVIWTCCRLSDEREEGVACFR